MRSSSIFRWRVRRTACSGGVFRDAFRDASWDEWEAAMRLTTSLPSVTHVKIKTYARTDRFVPEVGFHGLWRPRGPHCPDEGRSGDAAALDDGSGVPRSSRRDQSDPRAEFHPDGDSH